MKEIEPYLNKITYGDCLPILKSLPDKCVDLVLTDPPYGMNYQSAWRTATPQYEKIEGDIDLSWFPEFAKEIYRVLADDRHAYIFCNDYAISDFRKELTHVGFSIKRTLVWVKNNHTSGDLEGDYGNKTEFILYAQKGRRELNGGRDTNVLNFNRSLNNLHPTQKPVELCEFIIEKSSSENEKVLDPFLGSGTTAIAAKLLKRNFIGIEKEQKYVDIANERLSKMTQQLF